MMPILEAPLNHKLLVVADPLDAMGELSDISSRLMHLGFIAGATIEIKKKSPLFSGPLLIEVRGRWIALSQSEAKLLNVELKS